jgi:replication-associated recombination protein RarA
MILWGPPGVGKTTLARLTAQAFDCEFIALSAVFSGVKDIRAAMEQAQHNLDMGSTPSCSSTRSTASTKLSSLLNQILTKVIVQILGFPIVLRGSMADLFAQEPAAPLAEALRPKTLDEVIGQSHLLGEGKPLRLAFQSGKPHSMIFWGPPGVGKTTLARLTATAFKCEFIALSAVFSGVKDIRGNGTSKAVSCAGQEHHLVRRRNSQVQ